MTLANRVLLALGACSLLCGSAASAQTTAFVGARVIDGAGKVLERATVVFEECRRRFRREGSA